MSGTIHYQRNRDMMLDRAKEYFKNDKGRFREKSRN